MPFQPLLVSFLALSSVASAAPLVLVSNNHLTNNTLVNGVGTLANLGVAGTYTILASTGLASNASKIIGNVGISPPMTDYTGLALKQANATSYATSSQVSGKLFAADTVNSNSATAISNAKDAYASLKSQVAPQPDFYSAALDGQSLSPGIYSWTTAVVLGTGGKLTLKGRCGDVFIFQVTGAISSGADSSIILAGGLTANSVYWVGSTSLSTGARSIWQGINLLYTNVVIGTGATLIGAVFSQTEVALQNAQVEPSLAGAGPAVTNPNYPNMCLVGYHVFSKVPGLTPPSIGGSSTPGINGSGLDNSGTVAMPITKSE